MDCERRAATAAVILMSCASMIGAVACGSNGSIPDVVDSGPDAAGADADLCTCQPAETLHSEQITRSLNERPVSSWSDISGLTVLCEEGSKALGGGCTHRPSHSSVEIRYTGVRPGDSEDSWTCDMSNLTSVERTLELHIACVASGDDVEQPIGCGCAPVEPLFDRIVRATSTATLAGYGAAILGATCEPDAVLVGGGCSVDHSLRLSSSVTVSRTGIEPTLPWTWMCGWKNSGDTSGMVQAMAICIAPPSPGTAPEAEPLAGRVTYVTEPRTLPTNSSLNNTVACPAGDALLLGGCMVDRADLQSDRVTLFQQGFDEANPNAWRCGWNNPTDTTPTATATAICLKPPTP